MGLWKLFVISGFFKRHFGLFHNLKLTVILRSHAFQQYTQTSEERKNWVAIASDISLYHDLFSDFSKSYSGAYCFFFYTSKSESKWPCWLFLWTFAPKKYYKRFKSGLEYSRFWTHFLMCGIRSNLKHYNFRKNRKTSHDLVIYPRLSQTLFFSSDVCAYCWKARELRITVNFRFWKSGCNFRFYRQKGRSVS